MYHNYFICPGSSLWCFTVFRNRSGVRFSCHWNLDHATPVAGTGTSIRMPFWDRTFNATTTRDTHDTDTPLFHWPDNLTCRPKKSCFLAFFSSRRSGWRWPPDPFLLVIIPSSSTDSFTHFGSEFYWRKGIPSCWVFLVDSTPTLIIALGNRTWDIHYRFVCYMSFIAPLRTAGYSRGKALFVYFFFFSPPLRMGIHHDGTTRY